MGKRWLASADGSNKKYSVETEATIGADIGQNLRLDGQVLSLAQLKAILGTVSTRVVAGSGTASQGGAVLPPGGDLTTDMVIEGRSNLYFTDERAQDAVGSILIDSANITLDYVDATPSIQADLTDTGVTGGTYGDATHVARITVDAKGRITAISLVAITGGGGGSPLTTKGDIFTHSTVDARLPVGSDDQVIFADSGQTTGLRWGNPVWLNLAGGILTGDVTGTNFFVGAGGNVGGGGFFTSPTRGYVLDTIVAGVQGGFFRIGPDGSTATRAEFRIDNTSNDSFANIALAVNVDGSTDMLGRFLMASGVVFGGILRPSISGAFNNWSPTGLIVSSLTAASTIHATLTADASVTGLSAAQVDGTTISVTNQSAFLLTLTNASASSTAANRFAFPSDIVLQQFESVTLRYNATTARWNQSGKKPVASAGWMEAFAFPSAIVGDDLYYFFEDEVTLQGNAIENDSAGSIVYDLQVCPLASYAPGTRPTGTDTIVAAAPPTTVTARGSVDQTLGGWTKKIPAKSFLRMVVTSTSGAGGSILMLWGVKTDPAGTVGPVGPPSRIPIPLFDGDVSTKADATNKRRLGGRYINPADPSWGTTALSTATLFMLLETTAPANAAAGDLEYKATAGGAPTTVASVPTTSATVATMVSVDVTAAFLPTSPAGYFAARAWITTADGSQTTCSGAYIEIKP